MNGISWISASSTTVLALGEGEQGQIRFLLGSTPDLEGGAYSAPPNALAAFKGDYF